MFITNGDRADYLICFLVTDPENADRHRRHSMIMVETDRQGFEANHLTGKLGIRASDTAEITFNNVKVPYSNLVGPLGNGFAEAMFLFNLDRVVIAAQAVGTARGALEESIRHVKKRVAFNAPLASFQAIQFKIAEMYQKVETARLLVWKAAWEADNGSDPTITASIAKFYATEAAFEVVNEALQIFGGYGYTKMFPLEKLLRDTRLLRIYEGTSEIQRLIVSGYAMGEYQPVMPHLEDLPMLWEIDRDTAKKKDQPSWRCRMCGHVHYGQKPPNECPYCFFPKTAFKQIWPVGN